MATIDIIRKKVQSREYEFTLPHFLQEMANDNLVLADIENAVAGGRIRRRFSRDPRGTRYEVVGPAMDGRHMAVVCRIKETGKLLLITTYITD